MEIERMEIEKVEKPVDNFYDRKEYVIRIRNLIKALNLGLVLKKVNRNIKFKQEACLKSHIDMNTELQKKQKIVSKKICLS